MRRYVWCICLVLIAEAGCSPASEPVDPPRYNVMLITLDTTRADRLGCYGYDKPTSPNLDSLAAESALFRRAYVSASNTPVSHASILTGKHPYEHNLRVLHGTTENVLADKYVTLAELFRRAGAATGGFVSAFPVTERFGLQQGFDRWDAQFEDNNLDDAVGPGGMVNTGLHQRRADGTTNAALAWLKGVSEPFFAWVHYFDPHDPAILPPREWLEKFTPKSMTMPDRLRAIYDADTAYMDFQLGRLFDGLKERGLWDATIIAVVADHGEGLGDHNWWSHGILYDEQIRVPMIVRLPGASEGRMFDTLVQSVDIMPTVLEYAGIDRRHWPKMNGRSLVDLIQDGTAPVPVRAYSDGVNMLVYRNPLGADKKFDKLYCLVDDTWKYIFHQLRPAESELYNLRDDPGELRNLLAAESAVAERFQAELAELNCFSDLLPEHLRTKPEMMKKLKELGYVGE